MMSRAIAAAAALLLLAPAISLADKKPARGSKTASDLVPSSRYGEVKPCQACREGSPIYPEWMNPAPILPPVGGLGAFGAELRSQLLWDQHECAPDGCIKPIGCGNLWTEIKFIFGSCRQFFGTAESTVGHHRGTRERYTVAPPAH